eukprot:767974-Hanusia_phi.AAC.1
MHAIDGLGSGRACGCECGGESICQADVQQDSAGALPLHYAAGGGKVDTCSLYGSASLQSMCEMGESVQVSLPWEPCRCQSCDFGRADSSALRSLAPPAVPRSSHSSPCAAAMSGYVGTTLRLLQHGADLYKRSIDGKTAYDVVAIAFRQGSRHVCYLIQCWIFQYKMDLRAASSLLPGLLPALTDFARE